MAKHKRSSYQRVSQYDRMRISLERGPNVREYGLRFTKEGRRLVKRPLEGLPRKCASCDYFGDDFRDNGYGLPASYCCECMLKRVRAYYVKHRRTYLDRMLELASAACCAVDGVLD